MMRAFYARIRFIGELVAVAFWFLVGAGVGYVLARGGGCL